MKKDMIEVTDELLACYLEGKLTVNEKAAVERYLSEHEDALDAVILAKYELGFKRVKQRFYFISAIVLLLVAILGLVIWRLLTPIQMKVNLTEDAAFAVPAMPFEGGTLQCEYAGNALQTISITPENMTVFLNDMPYRFKGSPVHLVFEANGYQTIDTVVKAQSSVELRIKRNNDLGVVFGRVCDFVTGQPIEGATVSLLDYSVNTDALGQFRIEIPFGQQDKTQRVLITKDGYQPWDELYRPSATEPWLVSLEKGGLQ
ncbi:MAG: carboxypeptidase regulatory-like domain-containing protein [Bacteroidales bacterium]|nr:carboxypeptidase regulatory-like domain-containing protein [Bacteroidales bacterium]